MSNTLPVSRGFFIGIKSVAQTFDFAIAFADSRAVISLMVHKCKCRNLFKISELRPTLASR